MKQLDFEELWKNQFFDYKDGDLLVLDNISRMDFSAYESTALSFLATGYCDCGSMKVVIEGREYLIAAGDLFVYMPGQRIDRMSKSADARVRVMAFPRSAVIRSIIPSEETPQGKPDTVRFRLKPFKTHLFDAETGARVPFTAV